uniref:Endonuclease/exonuclease/phosphatase domain-containing protein n=1 Tax=Peronospora matthiolae TaxID=2874970 RepID=A0AAV1T278_9STRA
MACIDELQATKVEATQALPLVLRFGGSHYSALLHSAGVADPLNLTDTQDGPREKSASALLSDNKRLPDSGDRTSIVIYDAGDAVARTSAQPSCQLALTSTSSSCSERGMASAARKRGHGGSPPLLAASADPGAVVPIGSRHKKGRVRSALRNSSLDAPDDRIDRDEWPELWSYLGAEWPTTAATPYPLVYGDSNGCETTARLEPELLLHHLRRFVFPDERVTELPTGVWLDQWIARSQQRLSPSLLAPLIDNSDDWRKLRGINYAGDDILRLCDPHRRVRMSHHLMCAIVFDNEIFALTGLAESQYALPSNSVATLAYFRPIVPTRIRTTQTGMLRSTGLRSFAILLLLWPRQSRGSSSSTKGSLQQHSFFSPEVPFFEKADAYSRHRKLQNWSPSWTSAVNSPDSRGGDRLLISQNVRGFKASAREGWMSAWRGAPQIRRPQALCIQETHVRTDEEAGRLSSRWAQLWDQHLDPDAPPLSFWSIGSSSIAAVAILLTPHSARTASAWEPERWSPRAIAISIGEDVLINVYAPTLRVEREDFFTSLLSWNYMASNTIIAGDFNCVQCPLLDRYGSHRSHRSESPALDAAVATLSLADARDLRDHADD